MSDSTSQSGIISQARQWLLRHLREVMELKTSPESLAFGFAVATLISLLPTFGFGTLIGAGIVLVFKRISKIALFAGLAFWNPVLVLPIYSGAFVLGDWLFGNIPVQSVEIDTFERVVTYSRRFLVGNVILAVGLTVLGYAGVWLLASRWQRRSAGSS